MDMHLMQLGILLFLLGLLTGLAGLKLKNPRMGLASHFQGVMERRVPGNPRVDLAATRVIARMVGRHLLAQLCMPHSRLIINPAD
jgi:hypothetical protein